VHNLLVALITSISHIHEYLSIVFKLVLKNEFDEPSSWLRKEMNLTYLNSDFKHVTQEGLG